MPTDTRARGAAIGSKTLNEALAGVLSAIQNNRECFPRQLSRTRIAISLINGERLELDMDSRSGGGEELPAGWSDPAHTDRVRPFVAEEALDSIDDLDLSTSARAAAESLLSQFPSDVKFTSGRRSISEQASAMAPNVVKNRKWIEQTYKDTPQRAALQKWIDDHPEAKTAASIAVGLEGVMNGWSESEQRNFSRHITGDAFDIQPVAGETGKKIKDAIAKLPKLNWHTFTEGGLVIWHAQFDA